MAPHVDEKWAAVDEYVEESILGTEPALALATQTARDAGLPPIAVSPAQGKFLRLLVAATGARRILEIGTLAGYSTIWMAGGITDGGRIVTLEIESRHAEVARSNFERAGVADRIEIMLGPALESLRSLSGAASRPFDLVFIDADKANIPAYFEHSVALSRPGAVIIVDNVVRQGALADPAAEDDPNVAGVRRFHEMLSGRTDVEATTLQTVGSKGYDGFTLALVRPLGPGGTDGEA